MTPRGAAPSGRLAAFDPELLDLDARTALDQVLAGRGRLPTPFRVWLANPELARRMAPLGELFAGASSLTKAETELVILVTAGRLDAEYVAAVHRREALEAGLTADVVDAALAARIPPLADARQLALVDALLALDAPGVPSEAVFRAAVEALGERGVAEALALAGYYTAVCLAMKMYAIAPPEAPRR